LNLAALGLNSLKQPVLAVLSSSFYAVETIKRISQATTLVGTGIFDPFLFAEHMEPWAWGELRPARFADLQESFHAMLWAEALMRSGEATLKSLAPLALRGCTLEIITVSGLGAGQPKRGKSSKPEFESLKPGKLMKLLQQHGWIVDAVVPFHGLRSSFWQRLGDLFQRMEWLAWSDRCYLTLRSQMREPAWLWPLASLVLIRARKP
jgi:hypothetical protein